MGYNAWQTHRPSPLQPGEKSPGVTVHTPFIRVSGWPVSRQLYTHSLDDVNSHWWHFWPGEHLVQHFIPQL